MKEIDYYRPTTAISTEIEIKNSRFIAYLEPVNSIAEADAAKAKIKAHHPHARHWCWAQIAGTPFDVYASGSSDDGEPAGTAGRPMLAVLTGKPAGYLMVMVVRYFGGIKLGTGGLVRAYSAAVRAVFELAEWQLCLPMTQLELIVPYNFHQSVLHLLQSLDGVVVGNDFSDKIVLNIALPKNNAEKFKQQLVELASGVISTNPA